MPPASPASQTNLAQSTPTNSSTMLLSLTGVTHDSTVDLRHESIKLPDLIEQSEAGGFFFIDLDEIVHAGGALLSQTYQTLILPPVMIALTILAGKCGWDMLQKANENTKKFDEELKSLKDERKEVLSQKLEIEEEIQLIQEEIQLIQKEMARQEKIRQLLIRRPASQLQPELQPRLTSPFPPTTLSDLIKKLNEEKKVPLERERWLDQKIETASSKVKINQMNKGLGAATLGSAIIIFLKTLLEGAVQLGVIVSSGMVTAAGLGLTLAAAGCAIAIGVYFVRKSIALKNARQTGSEQFEKLLNEKFIKDLSDSGNGEKNFFSNYLNQLKEKIQEGGKFDKYFLWSNVGFLCSSIVYTFGAAGLAICVANPAILTTIGAFAMLACSHQFIFGHEQHEAYDSHRTEDAPGLDRNFHAAVELKLGTEESFTLRTKLAKCYQVQDEVQQALLKVSDRPQKRLPLLNGSLTYEANEPNETSLKEWLEKPAGNRALIEFMRKTLTAQHEYLKEKNTVHQKMASKMVRADEDFKQGKGFSLEKEIASLKEKDASLAEQINLLLAALNTLDPPLTLVTSLSEGPVSPDLLDSQKLVEIKKAFIHYQRTQIIDSHIKWSDDELSKLADVKERQSVDELLTQYLLDKSYQVSFNKLVETEFQAGRLREAKAQSKNAAEISRAPAENASLYQQRIENIRVTA